jgi:hypothetical protein
VTIVDSAPTMSRVGIRSDAKGGGGVESSLRIVIAAARENGSRSRRFDRLLDRREGRIGQQAVRRGRDLARIHLQRGIEEDELLDARAIGGQQLDGEAAAEAVADERRAGDAHGIERLAHVAKVHREVPRRIRARRAVPAEIGRDEAEGAEAVGESAEHLR